VEPLKLVIIHLMQRRLSHILRCYLMTQRRQMTLKDVCGDDNVI